jgi:hypothetical protein
VEPDKTNSTTPTDTTTNTSEQHYALPPDESRSTSSSKTVATKSPTGGGSAESENLPATTAKEAATKEATNPAATGADKPPGMWEKNKKWLKPTLIGLGGLALLFGGHKAYEAHKAAETAPKALSGVKPKKRGAGRKKKVEPLM